MTILERAAQAVEDLLEEPMVVVLPVMAEDIVKAVLRAIREPDNKMLEAASSFKTFTGEIQHDDHEAALAREVWHDMINAALGEP